MKVWDNPMIIRMDDSSPVGKNPTNPVQGGAGPGGEMIISARQLIQIIPVAWDEGDVKDYKVRANPLLERQQAANSLRQYMTMCNV